MIISIVAALDDDMGIGKAGGLPWRLSADMRRFKTLTMGHTLIMGRKTWESIGKALPGRISMVVTRSLKYSAAGAEVFTSLENALETAERQGETETFVIGGAQIFELALPLADRMYLTRVHARLDCDVLFPKYREEHWLEIERQDLLANEDNNYPTTYLILKRIGRMPEL